MYTVGCDPEIFIKEKGRIVSFHNRLNGKVKESIPFGYGRILEDGCSLEFNLPPALSCNEFDTGIDLMLKDIKHKWDYSEESSYLFDEKEIDSPLCWISGCDTSLNILTNRKTRAIRYCDGFRAAGGHVHLGWTNPTKQQRRQVGILCDYYLGLPSLLLDKKGSQRRKLYGKAGDVRIKPYGIEYRTLSNFWIFERKNREWVYTQTIKAIEDGLNDDRFSKIVTSVNPSWVQQVIDTEQGIEDCILACQEVLL